jgi:hypothetical protein
VICAEDCCPRCHAAGALPDVLGAHNRSPVAVCCPGVPVYRAGETGGPSGPALPLVGGSGLGRGRGMNDDLAEGREEVELGGIVVVGLDDERPAILTSFPTP